MAERRSLDRGRPPQERHGKSGQPAYHSTQNTGRTTVAQVDLLSLQKLAGNGAVSTLFPSRSTAKTKRVAKPVQRQVADPNAAARAEWDAQKGIHAHFRGGFDGGKDSYMDLRALYQAKGIADPADYLAAHIVWLSFFGRGTPAHKDLGSKLSAAENALKAAKIVPSIKDFWAFVPRRQAGGPLSNHALGRAIDINRSSNPHIKNNGDILVIRTVTGVDLGSSPTAADMRAASLSFQSQFNDAWVDRQKATLTSLKAVAKPSAANKEQLATVTKLVAATKQRTKTLEGYATAGFFNLEQALVDALTAAGFGWGGDYGDSKDFMHFEAP